MRLAQRVLHFIPIYHGNTCLQLMMYLITASLLRSLRNLTLLSLYILHSPQNQMLQPVNKQFR